MFFSSIEIKKYVGMKTNKKAKRFSKKSLMNPVTQMERNMKLKKYDKLRSTHFSLKVEKSIFNSGRITRMTDNEMKEFERCKEARFHNESSPELFLHLLETFCGEDFSEI